MFGTGLIFEGRTASTTSIFDGKTSKKFTLGLADPTVFRNDSAFAISAPWATPLSAVLLTEPPIPSAQLLPWPDSEKFQVTSFIANEFMK